MLEGKTVLLGVTGSIAAYKIAYLASALKKQQADVHVLMTRNATNFINPITFETLTGNKCLVDTFDRNFQFQVEHVSIAKKADVVMIAPEQGTIDAPIGRAADSTIERQVDFANGESAVTHYERLATYHSYSLIELHLETGRTHQIRVHMKYIGHPLPGDFLYNPDYRIIKRQPLHSFQLEFAHPVTGENMCITAPVPEDFADAFHRS